MTMGRANRRSPKAQPSEKVLQRALREIESDTHWFVSAAGAVSRDDLVGMLQSVRKRLEAVGYA